MKTKYKESVNIPEGIECKLEDFKLECNKGDRSFSKKIAINGINIVIKDGEISIVCDKANKGTIKSIKSNIVHILNGFKGLEEDFVYELEICNVHFPMTVKVENDSVVISNFLGEKTLRTSKILEGIKVDVKGKEIIVSGSDISKAGQTAANLEKATKVKGRDRRVFQDGIFMTKKPGREI